MSNENFLRSIIFYLKTQRSYLYSPINIIENDETCSLHFNYLNSPVEIAIYNPQFIKVKINNELVNICCNMDSLRVAIDDLQRIRFDYER